MALKRYTLLNPVVTEDNRAFFPGPLCLEEELIEEIITLDCRAQMRRKVEMKNLPDQPDGPVKTVWYECEVGERIHVERLMDYHEILHFYEMDGFSYCDTPMMSFQGHRSWAGWYVRIE